MLQLPLIGSGTQGLTKGPGAARTDDASVLAGLLQGADGTMAGFSGELQAMLMQLSPQMLQRLGELLTGGMSLPQAANSLLAESIPAFGGEQFADFLKQRVTATGDGVSVAPDLAADKGAVLFGQLAEQLRTPGMVPRELAAAAPALVALQAAVQHAGGNLTPQIAGSLLDMGVPQPVGAKGWDGAIGDRLLWMVQGDQQVAKLTLNPPNLGPLEVRLSVQHDQASVSFMAAHVAVREALEAALPRLREMFDQQSLQLVRADVSDPGAQHGDRTEDSPVRSPWVGRWDGDSGNVIDTPGDMSRVTAGSGLVDLFA